MSGPAQHTPGPWHWVPRWTETAAPVAILLETEAPDRPHNDPVIMAVREDWIRPGVKFWHETPDARLIAAAPALADALRRLVDVTPDVPRANATAFHLRIADAKDNARAVLAAMGEAGK